VNQLNSIHVDTNFQQNVSTTFAQSSTVTNINMSCDNVSALSSIDNVLADNVHNTINSSTCQIGMFIISAIYN
jgi:hypothetical protein